MDLKAKLRQIDQQHGILAPAPARTEVRPIEQVLEGEVCQTPVGSCFVHRRSFALDYRHGRVALESALRVAAESLAFVAKNARCSAVRLRDAIFLDTETTGLSGGAGTCAFLIGIGYFTDGEFCVEQYVMRDFHEERACLYLAAEKISQASGLISFNGKSFDLPILKSRMVSGRLSVSFDAIPHIDLLYPARRLWKHRIGSCTLAQVEHFVVGHQRQGDIPGALVPQLYFDYLATGDAQPLVKVFHHNRDDILSLVAVAAKACDVFERPVEFAVQPRDALALGKTLEDMKSLRRTTEIYQSVLDTQSPGPDTGELTLRLAACYKRLGRWSEAVSLWKRMIDGSRFDPIPYVELAKYYEHQVGDYLAAREIVQRALAALELRSQLRPGGDVTNLRRELLHRLQRVERKLRKATKTSR